MSDFVAGGGLFFLTLPLMVLVAIAIKCDSKGPICAREERIDPRGRRFFALKFRCTVSRGQHEQAIADDFTFVGGIIRLLRIDNLPQLINVLRGEMTCVVGKDDHLFFLE